MKVKMEKRVWRVKKGVDISECYPRELKSEYTGKMQ